MKKKLNALFSFVNIFDVKLGQDSLCQGATITDCIALFWDQTCRDFNVEKRLTYVDPKNKIVLLSTFFCCLSQIGDQCQYLEGPISTWKDPNILRCNTGTSYLIVISLQTKRVVREEFSYLCYYSFGEKNGLRLLIVDKYLS